MSAYPAAARTDVGGHRERNEDAAWADGWWWAVADGMGGHHGGEVASALALDAVRERLEPAPPVHTVEQVAALLLAAAQDAAAALRRRGTDEPDLESMGTTLVIAALCGPEVLVANVGDSRAYVLLDGVLTRVTRDDNVAEEMLSLGLITPDQAQNHPGQYQLTNAVTAYDDRLRPPTVSRVAARGRLLLCSDGLTGELDDATIARLLAPGTVEEAAQALLDEAVRAPARDNVTTVVVDLGD